jgi:gibberellin receptor GID1
VCIKAHILIQPFFGGEERTPSEKRSVPIISAASTDFYWRAYLPQGANRDHPACNIFGPNSSDLSNVPLPPSLVIAGWIDVLEDWEVKLFAYFFSLHTVFEYCAFHDGLQHQRAHFCFS